MIDLSKFRPGMLRLGIIVVPWLVAAAYLGILAADRYVAEAVVAVRQEGSALGFAAGFDPLAAIFGNTTASREDQRMLEAHILSMDMLRQLNEKLDLRSAYSSPALDFIFRLSSPASQESFLSYYRKNVQVVVDDASGLLTIRTHAFSPEIAYEINREIVEISELFINESSHRLARDQMAFAESEAQKIRAQLDSVRHRLIEFQGKHGILDPTAQAAAISGLAAEFQAMLAVHEAELKTLQAYLNNDAPQVRALQGTIDGLRAQLEIEQQRSVVNPQGASLNVLAGDYQELIAELEFVQDAYRAALTGLETARIESTRKLKSLVLVGSPAMPETAQYPRRAYMLFALLLGLTMLYGIARLVVATIEDHQE